MKQIMKTLLLAFVMVSFSVVTFAQATATATATIVTPIAISKTTDMSFGNLYASGSLGTAVIDPSGTLSVTGGVTQATPTGTVTAATFNVTGMANWTYSITLPAAANVISSGANNMDVDTWISSPTVGAGGQLDGTGAQTLSVGATLRVAAGQAAGTYVSGAAFTVTVNYN